MKTPAQVQCGHTKKCGWAGTDDDFIYIETERDKRLAVETGIRSRTGSCPKCGGTEFYYPRRNTTKTPKERK